MRRPHLAGAQRVGGKLGIQTVPSGPKSRRRGWRERLRTRRLRESSSVTCQRQDGCTTVRMARATRRLRPVALASSALPRGVRVLWEEALQQSSQTSLPVGGRPRHLARHGSQCRGRPPLQQTCRLAEPEDERQAPQSASATVPSAQARRRRPHVSSASTATLYSAISAEHNSEVALWRRARRLLSGYAHATAARVVGSLGRSTAESRVERSAGMC